MTPIPLEQIGLRWRDHKSALWWLGLLYRRPSQFENALKDSPRWQAVKSGVALYLHALIYLVSTCIVVRLIVFEWLKIPTKEKLETTFPILQYHLFQIVDGIATGIVFGITVGVAVGLASVIIFEPARGIARGIAFAITLAIAFGIAGGITFEITFVIAFLVTVGIAVGITSGIAAGIVFGITNGIIIVILSGSTSGIVSGIAFGITFIISVWRAYYHPFYWWLVWPKLRGHLYPYHPVAWDDLCSVPFPRLDRLLVAYAEYAPELGKREIERLIQSYPSQRHAALKAQNILLARQAAQ
jgi:hypothetical protein